MRVRPEPTRPGRPNDPIPGTPEEVERDIDYWTDKLAECSGGSEQAYAIDTRLRRLARAKERLGSAGQDIKPNKPAERADKNTSDRAEIVAPHPKSARIEKTVFISYRRIAVSWAQSIFQDLTQHGYDVFFDFQGIASGSFEEVILENRALSANLTERPLLRNFLHPLNREEPTLVTAIRSEERRVGKECRSRRQAYHRKK